MGEFSKQLGWLVQACTTDVVKQVMGVKKKKKKKYGDRYHVYTHYHFYGKKKPHR